MSHSATPRGCYRKPLGNDKGIDMRPIPKEIIDQIDDILGLKGRPHVNLSNGQWVETGAYEWNRLPSPGLLWMGSSLELRQAIANAYQEIQRTNSHIQSETDFLEHLKRTNPSSSKNMSHFIKNFVRLTSVSPTLWK